MVHPRTSDPTAFRALIRAHEAADRILETLGEHPHVGRAQVWPVARARLVRLLVLELRLLERQRPAHERAPTPWLDPRTPEHARAVVEMLDRLDATLGDPGAWETHLDDLQELLSWTFIAVESQAREEESAT